ncbi:hypothetical protein KY348_03530 [Candidatus Woesearchaeota archaeon]|nr:hypothetical protein [Candidatus Woesearchaeota archaeon]
MKYNRYAKKAVLAMIVLGLLYAGITSVFGVQGATNIDVGDTSRANLTNFTSSQSTAVQAGNVTEMNISGQAITNHWAGFYGEVSGNLTLGDSSGNVFYDWSGIGPPEGEVFASNASTLNWSGIGCANAAEITAIEGSLGITAGTDPDDIAGTYSNNNHPSFNVGTVSGISGCNSTNTYVNSAPSTDAFYQILLTDSNGYPVYTTLINDTEQGFDTNTHDFQLLVGESETVGTTTLYFFIELS